MPDVVVTVPQNFRWDDSPHTGLLAWADEGALPGEPDEFRGDFDFSTGGLRPDIEPLHRLRGQAARLRAAGQDGLHAAPRRLGLHHLLASRRCRGRDD